MDFKCLLIVQQMLGMNYSMLFLYKMRTGKMLTIGSRDSVIKRSGRQTLPPRSFFRLLLKKLISYTVFGKVIMTVH